MTILSLEFSALVRSVAIWVKDAEPSAQIVVTAEDHGAIRVHPLSLIGEALQRANLRAKDIDLIAVGLGPGSYTGIRSAIAVAQGWSLGHSVRVAGVSSVDCIAEQARRAGLLGKFHAVVDAQQDEFYVGDYETDGTVVTPQRELRILTRTEMLNLSFPLAGPDLAGCGLEGREIIPCANVVGIIAKKKDSYCEASALVPIYLRETAFVKAPPARILPL